MSKIGIGVGEEFPVDDAPEQDTRESCHSAYDAWRQAHDARHAEWHARAQRFKDDIRRSCIEHFGGSRHRRPDDNK